MEFGGRLSGALLVSAVEAIALKEKEPLVENAAAPKPRVRRVLGAPKLSQRWHSGCCDRRSCLCGAPQPPAAQVKRGRIVPRRIVALASLEAVAVPGDQGAPSMPSSRRASHVRPSIALCGLRELPVVPGDQDTPSMLSSRRPSRVRCSKGPEGLLPELAPLTPIPCGTDSSAPPSTTAAGSYSASLPLVASATPRKSVARERGEAADRATASSNSESVLPQIERANSRTFMAQKKSPRRDRMRRLDTGLAQRRLDGILESEREQQARLFQQLPQQEAADVTRIFRFFDGSSSGRLGKADAIAALHELGVRSYTSSEAAKFHEAVESGLRDCRGGSAAGDDPPSVNLPEFAIVMMRRVRSSLKDLRSGEMLKAFPGDSSGEGLISFAQLLRAARGFGLDRRMLQDVCGKFEDAGSAQCISLQDFEDAISHGVEARERFLRQRERELRATIGLNEEAFLEFREDIPFFLFSFKSYDSAAQGTLSMEALIAFCKESGIVPDQVVVSAEEGYLRQAASLNGGVSFNHFLSLLRATRSIRKRRELEIRQARYARYDKDRNGVLSVAEISLCLADVGLKPRNRMEQEELAAMIGGIDADGSGTIDFEEFHDLSHHVDERLRRWRYEEQNDFAMNLGFTLSQIRDFRVIFDILARDGDNDCARHELRTSLGSLQPGWHKHAVESFFRQVCAKGSEELKSMKFIDFLTSIHREQLNGPFAHEASRLPSSVNLLEDQLLRRALHLCGLKSLYVKALFRQELVEVFCSCFDIAPKDDLPSALAVSTVSELYKLARSLRQDSCIN